MARGRSADPSIAIFIIAILTLSATIGYVYVTAVNPCPSINYSFPNDYSVSMSVCSTTSSTSSTGTITTTSTCLLVVTVYSVLQPCPGSGGGGGGNGGCGAGCFLATSTSTTTVTTITGCTGSIQCSNNPLWNANSQKVADLVVSCGWNSQIQMLHDICEPGCHDYVFGNLCNNTYWTTSDNVPTCWTLGSFGYNTVQQQCIAANTALGAFQQPRDGERYEAYTGSPITTGNACCIHTLINPSTGGADIQCPQTGCSGYTGVYPGTNTQYAFQTDEWNGGHAHTADCTANVDSAGPQAINAWLRGDKSTFNSCLNNMVQKYTSSGYVNTGSTWQLGQTIFVMRVGGMDQSNPAVFNSMVNELWSIQCSSGYLPNQYTASGPVSCNSHDPENEDAGLLGFCYTCVTNIQNSYAEFTYQSAPT